MSQSKRINLLGVNVSRYDLNETIDYMCDTIDEGKKMRMAVTPVNCILWAHKDKNLRDIYNSADMVTADGVPLIWASRLLGEPIHGRVTGLDLLPEFSKVAAQHGYRFFFLGAAPGVVEKLSEVLMRKNPDLNIAGIYTPPFADSFSEEENLKIIELINQSNANILWVSLTAPKQDFWIAEHFDLLKVNIAIGVGAAFDVVAGNIKRAPVWMQRVGLEWFFRLLMEPRRLAKRYLFEAPKFLPLVLKQKFQNKRYDQ